MNPPVSLPSSSTDCSSSVSSSVSTDTNNSSQFSFLILHRPILNPIPITSSLNTTPTNTPKLDPISTPIKLQTQKYLTLHLSDTEFPLTPFDITSTHSALPPHPHIPDPSDIDPILLSNNNKHQSRKSIVDPNSIKRRRRHSQFDPSLPLPKPCIHSQLETSLPSPKPLTTPALEFLTHSVKIPFE